MFADKSKRSSTIARKMQVGNAKEGKNEKIGTILA
jgi:hypothetical protein